MAGRPAGGSRRAEMKQIADEHSRIITFSKRKASIYKKANELITLCGADVAIVTSSPSGNLFSFAHPSIDIIVNQFVNRNPLPVDRFQSLVEPYRQARVNELNKQHDELSHHIEAEKAKNKILKRLTERKSNEAWWETPIEELDCEDLYKIKGRMEELHRRLMKSASQQTRGEASSSFHGQNLDNP